MKVKLFAIENMMSEHITLHTTHRVDIKYILYYGTTTL